MNIELAVDIVAALQESLAQKKPRKRGQSSAIIPFVMPKMDGTPFPE